MGECLQCGKAIPRRKEKGHREREYCSDVCRQRACRARNKHKHNLERVREEYLERWWNAQEQNIHRESWQDELKNQRKLIDQLIEDLNQAQIWNDFQEGTIHERELEIKLLQGELAEKEAEIARLNVLLDNQAKRKRT